VGRYRRDPLTGDLHHGHAVEVLATRLRKALGDWAKNEAFNGDPLRVLRYELVLTLGPKTLHHLFPTDLEVQCLPKTAAAVTEERNK
jgi:hypothetical protein